MVQKVNNLPILHSELISYFVSHDPTSTSEVRNFCVSHMKSLFEGNAKQLLAQQVFCMTEDDILNLIATLPKDSENISVNPILGETYTVVTQENVRNTWDFWRSAMDHRENLSSIYGNLVTQIRRFSLNLGILMTLDTFVRSNNAYFLTFEDDALLRQDFVEVLEMVMKDLPEGWDVFNFQNASGADRFQSNLQIAGTKLAISYMHNSTAALLWSRKGAKAVLNRLLIEVDEFEYGDPNGDMSIDSLICNLEMLPPFTGPQLGFNISYLPTRAFQSYGFIPEFKSPMEQLDLKSTWR